MALLQPLVTYEPAVEPSTAPRVRRCTFRRLSRVARGDDVSYEASCLYPDRRMPLPIGDSETGLAICRSCTASHIFRPDED